MSHAQHAAAVVHQLDPVPILAAGVAFATTATALQAAALTVGVASFAWTIYRDRRNWKIQAEKKERADRV